MRHDPAGRLRALLASKKPELLLEAHNALAAQVAEEAGFAGLWASSLTLSAAHGLRDDSELTMSQALDALEAMTERVRAPVLFDGDTGYGEWSHFQKLVRRLMRRDVAGVCIEDKVFPKTNSFLDSERQALAPLEEFCGKLRAGCDARGGADFCIVARTEALITGLGMEVALERARRYADAGADAILIHSKAATFAEVQDFATRWHAEGAGVPLVCVPTTYYSTPPEAFARAGISLVIYANQLLRASLGAMQRVAAKIRDDATARDVEDEIAPVREVFRLQAAEEQALRERRYAAPSGRSAVILAASRGEGLDALTRERPKCMIPLGGVPVVEKQLAHLRAEGIREIAIVRGYRAEAVCPAGVKLVDNPDFAETGELGSLGCARDQLRGDVVVAFGDIVYRRYVLHELLASDAALTVVVDGDRSFLGRGRVDRVRASGRPTPGYDETRYQLLDVTADLGDDEADGQWIGLLRARGEGTTWLADAVDRLLACPGGERRDLAALLRHLVKDRGVPVRVVAIHGGWVDINSLDDVARGNAEP